MSTASGPSTSNAGNSGPNLAKQPSKRLLRKKPSSSNGGGSRKGSNSADRTVRRLRLSKALTIPDEISVAETCRRMAARRADAVLLTDSKGLLCGIVTDRDLSMKVVGEGLSMVDTPVSRVMTRNPVFVTIDSSAVDALQKMVQGKFRHLPVVEDNEVVALLDITKCLYDAIARMERAAEKGHAMAAALEGVERQYGNSIATPSFIETFRDKMFRPTLGSLVGEQNKLATVQGTDAVYVAAKKMRELKVSSVIVTGENSNKPRGILTSKDILMRVMALGLSPEETPIEKVMTPNPECANLDTTIVDALHTMHDGKFLHLPLVDRNGNAVACVDVIQLTHGAVKTAVGNSGGGMEQADTMMQKFWDSALALEPPEAEDDATSVRSSEFSEQVPSDRIGTGPPAGTFAFKMEDKRGRVHRFNCGTESLTELSASVASRCGSDYDHEHPPLITYVDEDGDKVMLSNDDDLSAAVQFARTSQAKSLKIHLDFTRKDPESVASKPLKASVGSADPLPVVIESPEQETDEINSYSTTILVAATVLCVGIGVAFYLRRTT